MITPDDIRWATPARPLPELAHRALDCPVCGSTGHYDPTLQVPSMSSDALLTLLHCRACGSRYYDPPDITEFSELIENQDDFSRFYVEVGGGVWDTIWPTVAEHIEGPRTLLDVGCGFGFAVDFWRQTIGGEAVGVELADYGRLGASALGVPIYNDLLQNCAALAGRRFDVVYASEVIEHVADPTAFVALLERYVADDGILVLTTPNAGFIERAQHSATLLAALAPGFHGFLLSQQAFADIATKCGFAYVDVRAFGERQVLWASRRPMRLDPQQPAMLTAYLDYLARRILTLEPSSPVWQGYSYRRIRDLLNAGRISDAKPVALALMATLIAAYGSDIADPAAVLARLKRCHTLTEYGRAVPYFLPGLYYFLGLLAQHHDRDSELALRYYGGAVDCTLEFATLGPVLFLEAISLLWPARAREAELRLARGDIAAGVALFARIADQGSDCDARNAFALASRDLLEVTVPQLCDQLWTAGYKSDATTLFDSYCRYVQRQYGAAVVTTAGIEAALSGGAHRLPLDPLFAAYFSGRQGTPGDIAVADLVAVSRIGEVYSRDPTHGERLRESAERARRLLPANMGGVSPKPAANWSFEMTYTVPARQQ